MKAIHGGKTKNDKIDSYKIAMNLAIQADLTMIDAFNRLIKPLEGQIERIACQHDPNNLHLLKTIPGVGQILLRSPKNTRRLIESIAQLENGKGNEKELIE